MAKKKAKVVKARVVKCKSNKLRKSKGAIESWEVWSVGPSSGRHSFDCAFDTEQEARNHIDMNPKLIAPVIICIDIPPMSY